MTIGVEITESEISEAVHRGIKKIIVDEITTASWKGWKLRTVLTEVVDRMLPKIVEDAIVDFDIKKMVELAVENKAKFLIRGLVNRRGND